MVRNNKRNKTNTNPRPKRKRFNKTKWDRRGKQAKGVLQDGGTLLDGAKRAKDGGLRRFGTNIVDQVKDGTRNPLKLNFTNATEQAIGTDAIHVSRKINRKGKEARDYIVNMWRKTGQGNPEPTRQTNGTWSDPLYVVNRDKSQGGDMPNGNGNGGNGGRGGGDPNFNHPSRQYSDASSVPVNPFNDTTTVDGPIELNSYMSRALMMSPYESQTEFFDEDGINLIQTKRTHINFIDTGAHALFDFAGNTRLTVAYRRIYQAIRQEMVEAINSNQFTDKVMTVANFEQYMKVVTESWALLCEIKHRMAFQSSYAEQNLLLRAVSQQMQDPDLLVAVNSLETVLMKFALPAKLIEYYKWLFQCYKGSPVEGGVQYVNMSPFVASSLYRVSAGGTWDELIGKLNFQTAALWNAQSVYTDASSNEIGKWWDLSQYLVSKAQTGNFTDIGNCLTYCTEPVYDVDVNAIWDNSLSYSRNITGKPIFRFSEVAREDALIALPHNQDSVPAYVAAHMLSLYSLMDFTNKVGYTGGFPFFGNFIEGVNWADGMPGAYAPTTNFEQNKALLVTTATSPGLWIVDSVNKPEDYITDHIFSNAYTSSGVEFGLCSPRGMNVRYFSLSHTNVSTECVNLLYDMFAVTLDFG